MNTLCARKVEIDAENHLLDTICALKVLPLAPTFPDGLGMGRFSAGVAA